MRQPCPHAAAMADVPPPRDVCGDCVPIGGTWVNLRQCLTCGRTLCCNSSPNRHMQRHFDATGHPIMLGAMPGEGWRWCFVDDTTIRPAGDGWETYDAFVEAGLPVARHWMEVRGPDDPGEDVASADGFPIGEWFAYVREQREEGELDPADAADIEAIPGWRW